MSSRFAPLAAAALLVLFACTDGPHAGGQTGSELGCETDSDCTADLGDGYRCSPDLICVPESCTGEVICALAPPTCSGGTIPEIHNSCYTGDCIDASGCGNNVDDGGADAGIPPDEGSPEDGGTTLGATCGESAICALPPPSCAEGTLPEISGGCFTLACLGVGECLAHCPGDPDEPVCDVYPQNLDCPTGSAQSVVDCKPVCQSLADCTEVAPL